MILTAGKFEQIMATLKSESYGSHEKRQAPRVGMRMQVRILVHSKTAPVKGEMVWLRDVSSGGIGFTHATPIPTGTLLIASLPRGNSGSLKLLYRVVRCVSVDKQQYIIGAQLDRVLEDVVTATPSATATPTPPSAA